MEDQKTPYRQSGTISAFEPPSVRVTYTKTQEQRQTEALESIAQSLIALRMKTHQGEDQR